MYGSEKSYLLDTKTTMLIVDEKNIVVKNVKFFLNIQYYEYTSVHTVEKAISIMASYLSVYFFYLTRKTHRNSQTKTN